jgi:hypothetical protein
MVGHGLGFWLLNALCALILAWAILPWLVRFLPLPLQRAFSAPEIPPTSRRVLLTWRLIILIVMIVLFSLTQWRKWFG